MRYILLCLVVLFGSIYGCKRTTSESKGWGSVAKKASKAGKLSAEMQKAIEQAVKKATQKGEADDLRKLISQGGKVAEAAALAYRRSFSGRTDEWLEQMGQIDRRISLLKQEIPLGKRVDSWKFELDQEIRLAEYYTTEFLDVLEWRIFQVYELAYDSPEIVHKLCCDSINFNMLEETLTAHSKKLANDFDHIRDTLKAEQDLLAELQASTKGVSKGADEMTNIATQQNKVRGMLNEASNDAEFSYARILIDEAIQKGKQDDLKLVIVELLDTNPAKVDQFYQSFTNRRFADIEHALIETINEVTDSQGLYRTLDELLKGTRQLHGEILERHRIFKEIVNGDNLKVLQDNNRRYMVDGSKITKVPLSRRNSNLHWIEQLPKQIQLSVMNRFTKKGNIPKITGITRGEVRPRIVAIEQEVKAIKELCKGGLC